MNLEKTAAIGGIISSVAIVVTLIILVVEVRGNTAAIQAQTIQTAAALDQEFLVTVGADPVTAQTWATYLTAPDTLSESQNLQGAYLFASVVRRLENIYLQERLGAISDEGQESRQALLEGITRSEGFSAFLQSLPATLLTGEFRDYMVDLSTAE
jgi:hypothetical protein